MNTELKFINLLVFIDSPYIFMKIDLGSTRKSAILSVLLFVLMFVFVLAACGGGESSPAATNDTEPEPVLTPSPEPLVITIGNLTDVTGPSASAQEVINLALDDIINYYNDEDVIPGVAFELLHYATRLDPSRYTVGYEWLMQIIGGGLSGILHLQLARHSGAECVVVTDIVEYRFEAARRFGADAAIHAGEDVRARLREINEGRLADLVIICAGAEQAVLQGLHSVERGGTILLFAPPAPEANFPMAFYEMWRDGITFTTSYAGGPIDIAEAIRLIGSQNINVRDMITHRLGLAETGLGFQITAKAQDSLKVIVEPQH